MTKSIIVDGLFFSKGPASKIKSTSFSVIVSKTSSTEYGDLKPVLFALVDTIGFPKFLIMF